MDPFARLTVGSQRKKETMSPATAVPVAPASPALKKPLHYRRGCRPTKSGRKPGALLRVGAVYHGVRGQLLQGSYNCQGPTGLGLFLRTLLLKL